MPCLPQQALCRGLEMPQKWPITWRYRASQSGLADVESRTCHEAKRRAEARFCWWHVPNTSTAGALDDAEQAPRARIAPQHFEHTRCELEREFAERITLDGLTGEWFIFQRARGHRHSVDDVLTAAYALEVSPMVSRHLDLGTGIGTVGLLVLWGMGNHAHLTAIEAQTVSHRLLLANIAENRLTERVLPVHGDLREFEPSERFLLITGSPPYFPTSAGIVPHDSQKAHARFELRGDVSDYARAGKRHLAPDGWFVFCFPTPQKARALAAVLGSGLSVVRLRDVIPRAGLSPLFSLFACRHAADAVGCQVDVPLVVRDEQGRLSDEMQQVRARFGFVDVTR
jgi:tRNA1(Val) A37 N6-methylase TrmN6